jgi:hypothetical protein
MRTFDNEMFKLKNYIKNTMIVSKIIKALDGYQQYLNIY